MLRYALWTPFIHRNFLLALSPPARTYILSSKKETRANKKWPKVEAQFDQLDIQDTYYTYTSIIITLSFLTVILGSNSAPFTALSSPHSVPWGPFPAAGTRCSGCGRRAPDDWWCCHTYTGASASKSRTPALKEQTRTDTRVQRHCESLTAITTRLFWCDHPFHYRREVTWRGSAEIWGFCAVNYTCIVKGPRIPSNSLVHIHSNRMRAHHVVWLPLTCNQRDESVFLDCCLPLCCMTDLFAGAAPTQIKGFFVCFDVVRETRGIICF